MRKKSKRKGRVGKAKKRTRPYPYEFRIKMVRLYLEEGYSTPVNSLASFLYMPNR
jgi:transposase-like protein